MDLDLKQMVAMVDIIAEEKNLPKETVIDVIQQAIAAAWRKDNGDKDMDVRCELDLNTGEADVYVIREVIENDVAYNPATEIPLSDAKGKEIGDRVEEKFKVTGFGRVASQTAKQVVIQRLREAGVSTKVCLPSVISWMYFSPANAKLIGVLDQSRLTSQVDTLWLSLLPDRIIFGPVDGHSGSKNVTCHSPLSP